MKPVMAIGLVAALLVGIIVGMGMNNPESVSSFESSLVNGITEQNSQLTGDVAIGLILPLTGDQSTHGEENTAGAMLGMTDFNKYLKNLGADWNLKIVKEDSATNPVVALEKLTSINAKDIHVVVGPETSSSIRNIKGYADSNNMLLFSPSSTAPTLAIPNDSVYRLVPDDSNQGPAIAKVMKSNGIDILVPVWRGDAWSDGLSASTTKSFDKLGGVSDEGIRYNPEVPEFSVTASLLADKVQAHVDEFGADKVGVLFIGFSETLQFMQSASQHNILDEVKWFGSDGNSKENKLITDPIGLTFSQKVQFTTVQVSVSDNPIHKHVETSLTKELGRTPNTYAFSSYDIVWIIGLAMLETGSNDQLILKLSNTLQLMPSKQIPDNYHSSFRI